MSEDWGFGAINSTTSIHFPTATTQTIFQSYPQAQYQSRLRPLTMTDLTQHPAFQASLEELQDLWLVQFGSDWVDETRITAQGDFYEVAAQRLVSASRLEKHCLQTPWPGTVVYKITE